MSNRRDFLRTGAALAAQRALGLFPRPSDGRWRSNPTGAAARCAHHIVVLMQENRSFDHYFGGLAGVRGFGDRFPIPVPPAPNTNAAASGRSTTTALTAAAAPLPFRLDTRAPSRPCASPARRTPGPTPSRPGTTAAWASAGGQKNHSMAYYAEADLPFQYALAPAFPSATPTIARSPAAPTSTGCSCGPAPTTAPDAAMAPPWATPAHRRRPAGAYTWTTYPERLERAGIRWRIYQDMADNYALNPTAGFKAYRDAYQGLPGSLAALREKALSTRGLDRLRQDALDGTLPQVSWICPTGRLRASQPVQPGPGRRLYGARAGRADQSTGLEPHGAAADVRRERRLLRPHAAARPTLARCARRAGRRLDGDTRRIPRDHRGRGIRRYARASARRLWPGTARAHVRAVALVTRRWSTRRSSTTPRCCASSSNAGVAEPNISPWRRAVCGDLTSCSISARASPPFPGQPCRRPRAGSRPRCRAATPTAPDQPPPARQQPGLRPSRALPLRCTRMRRAATRDAAPG